MRRPDNPGTMSGTIQPTSGVPLPSVVLLHGPPEAPIPVTPQELAADPRLGQVRQQAQEALDWLDARFGHRGVDGAGAPLQVVAGRDTYYRAGRVHLGIDGTSKYRPMYRDIEAVRHELIHAVLDHYAPGLSQDMSEGRVIHEAWGVVLQNADDDDWLVNEDGIRPHAREAVSAPYDLSRPRYRHLADAPPDAYSHRAKTVASVAVRAAERLGRPFVMDVWFASLTQMGPNTDIARAAGLTVSEAHRRGGTGASSAVREAWQAIGVEPRIARDLRPLMAAGVVAGVALLALRFAR